LHTITRYPGIDDPGIIMVAKRAPHFLVSAFVNRVLMTQGQCSFTGRVFNGRVADMIQHIANDTRERDTVIFIKPAGGDRGCAKT
jgi:hypothetical protein